MAMHYELSLRDSQATEFAYESLHGLDRLELEPTWNHEPALNGDVDSPHGGSSQKIFPKGFSKPFRHSPEARRRFSAYGIMSARGNSFLG